MKKYSFVVLIAVISIVLFSLPAFVRDENRGIIGFPTYYHQRIAENILKTGALPDYDQLSFGGRPYLYPPAFHATLAFFALIFGLFEGGIFMLALFGAVCIVLVFLIMQEMFHDIQASFLASVITALMPATIFAFSHLCSRAPPIALGLASLYLLMREDKHTYLSMILLSISALFHLETALIFAVLCFPFLHNRWKSIDCKKHIIFPIIIAFIIAGSFYIPMFMENGFIQPNAIHNDYRALHYSMQSAGIQEYFIEISPYASATIIAAALALIGFFFADSKKYLYINYMRFWLVFIFLLTLIFERFLIYMAVPLAVMTVVGLSVVHNKVPKKTFPIILLIVLVWTGIGSAIKLNSMADEYPSAEQYQTFAWIRQNTPRNATIVSDWSYGHWISGIAQQRNFMDGYAEYAPQVNERYEQLQKLYANFTIPSLLANEPHIYLYAEKWILEKYHSIDDYSAHWQLIYRKNNIFVFKLR